MEKQLHDRVFRGLTLLKEIGRFLNTYLAFLLHPRSSFLNFFSSSHSQFTKPGAFLIVNIIFSLLLGYAIGYELPPFPIDLSPLLNRAGSYSSVVVRFLLGNFIFLLILKLLTRYKNLNIFFQKVFPTLCFSSVVYLPVLLFKNYWPQIVVPYYLNLLSNILFYGILPKSLGWSIIKCLLLPSLILILIGWWLWLIHRGLAFSKIKFLNLKRKLVWTFIIFFVLQFLSSIVMTTTKNWSFLCGVKTMCFKEIEAVSSKSPPDYLEAAILSADISDNENWPAFVRFVYKLKEASYLLATPFYEGDTTFTRQVLRELDLKEYTSVKNLLASHLHALSSNKKNPKRQLFFQLEKDLKEAEDFYNSPGFVDFGKECKVNIGFIWINSHESAYHFFDNKVIEIKLVVQPSLFTLFP